MRTLKFFLKYLSFLLRSSNAHGIHSPFVFELYNSVIRSNGHYYIFDRIEQVRRKLLATHREIQVTDLGTGTSGLRRISSIAERSLKSPRQAQLLFRLVKYFNSRNILELGTSLGITTSYLSAAHPKASITTIEGCASIADEAEKIFSSLQMDHIRLIRGSIDEILTRQPFPSPTPLDLVFFDGNHRKEPTLKYFETCLAHTNPATVFIFDDIHWSSEMEEAWDLIQRHPSVTVTVDLFHFGLVFFRPEQAKQHFQLRF